MKTHIEKYLAPLIGLLVTMIVGYNAYTQSRIDTKIDSIADGIVVLKIEATRAVERLSYHEILITQNGTLLEEHGAEILNLNYSVLRHCERTRALLPNSEEC